MDGHAAHLDGFPFNTLFGEDLFHFRQSQGGVAIFAGASVQKQNFHAVSSQLVKISRFGDSIPHLLPGGKWGISTKKRAQH
jgi:hypothetical protein